MMDILTIATREGNKAYELAKGNEAKSEAYHNTYKATLQRGRRAERILESGLVSRNGRPGRYYVGSQSGNGRYTVDVEARTCNCPDHLQRGTYCKHLQAAELYREGEEDRDPFAVDWKALAAEPVTSMYADSRSAAGCW